MAAFVKVRRLKWLDMFKASVILSIVTVRSYILGRVVPGYNLTDDTRKLTIAATISVRNQIMKTRSLGWTCVLAAAFTAFQASAALGTDFRVGASDKDITPPPGVPMWGYGARHEKPAEGTLDPLMAKAIVVAAGDDKVALVGIDIGRGPTEAMMKIIRQEIAAKAGIRHVLITGSHTHHGPVIELTDEPGLGQGKVRRCRRVFQEAAHTSWSKPSSRPTTASSPPGSVSPPSRSPSTETVTPSASRRLPTRSWSSSASTIRRASPSQSLSTSPRTR